MKHKTITVPTPPWEAANRLHAVAFEKFSGPITAADQINMVRAILQLCDENRELRERVRLIEMGQRKQNDDLGVKFNG